jgi:hypothetical protein
MSEQIAILLEQELRLIQLELDRLNADKVRLEMAIAQERQ